MAIHAVTCYAITNFYFAKECYSYGYYQYQKLNYVLNYCIYCSSYVTHIKKEDGKAEPYPQVFLTLTLRFACKVL